MADNQKLTKLKIGANGAEVVITPSPQELNDIYEMIDLINSRLDAQHLDEIRAMLNDVTERISVIETMMEEYNQGSDTEDDSSH